MPVRERRLLILGGTAEARVLAEEAIARFGRGLLITSSLAGRTRSSAALAGTVRRGGFGGADGLASYLRSAQIDFVIDATHPFAARISAACVEASRSLGAPLLALTRPPWTQQDGDHWIEVADAAEAAARLPALGRRAFLTIGHRDIAAFSALSDIHFLVRLIDPPPVPLPLRSCEVIRGRGPFTGDDERGMMERHEIDVVVTKASGGAATAGKLDAARALGIPVVMLRRPQQEGAERVESVAGALDWLARHLGNPEKEARS
jgi:precorrin-6A/cobalt-precorrin-6A reductase